MKRTLLLILLALQALVLSADVLKGRVVDDASGEPIEGAKIDINLQVPPRYGVYTFCSTDSVGCFYFEWPDMCKVTLTINYFGYNEYTKRLNMASGKDTVDIGDLRLKMSEALLKEIVVKAKVKRFYMKGDTVIFNPEAFNLDDGDRVATLLQKLPGVTITGGQLTYMGKPVHLKMNGHAVADEFLTGQLPAEAVQNIKAYEKKSETEELTGMKDGQEQQVLDIIIKPGFMDKWYGQAKASAYASKNYRLSANTHYLSDKFPVQVYGRASDNGSHTSAVWGDNDYEWGLQRPQRQQMGKIGMTHNWKREGVKTTYEDNWSISVSPDHLDERRRSWTTTQTLLSGQPSAYSDSENREYSHKFTLPINIYSRLHLAPQTTLRINGDAAYNRSVNTTNNEQQTYRGDDHSLTGLVNDYSSHARSVNKEGKTNLDLELTSVWDKITLRSHASANYSKTWSNSSSQTTYNYYDLGTTELLQQQKDYPQDRFETFLGANVRYQAIKEKLAFTAGYENVFTRTTDLLTAWRNGAIDLGNCTDMNLHTMQHKPSVEMDASLKDLWLNLRMTYTGRSDDMDHTRGGIYTPAQRTKWLPNPKLQLKWKIKKYMEMHASTNYQRHLPYILDCIDYTNDLDPLNIIKGNPNLRPSSSVNTSLQYNIMSTKASQMLNIRLGYTRDIDPTTQLLAYNTQTGGYTSTIVNVDKGDSWNASYTYECAMGDYVRFNANAYYNFLKKHTTQTLSALTDPLAFFCQQEHHIRPSIRFTYENKGLELIVGGQFIYNHASYTDPSLQNVNTWEYDPSIEAKYKLDKWIFYLGFRLEGTRGYFNESMNDDRFLLNARVTWKCLKNKGQLQLEAKDILNQNYLFYGEVTPLRRIEKRDELFNRYVELTFTYNFDAKAKKNKK